MFDNPNKELQRLQDQLLAAEAPEEEPLSAEEELEALREMLEQAEAEMEQETELPQRKKEINRKGRIGGIIAAMVLELLALGLVLIWWMLWRQ